MRGGGGGGAYAHAQCIARGRGGGEQTETRLAPLLLLLLLLLLLSLLLLGRRRGRVVLVLLCSPEHCWSLRHCCSGLGSFVAACACARFCKCRLSWSSVSATSGANVTGDFALASDATPKRSCTGTGTGTGSRV